MATIVTQCGFCRRVREGRSEATWQDAAHMTPIAPSGMLDVVLEETYCSDCNRFYEQLVTFGKGEPLPVERPFMTASAAEVSGRP
jgi:hypothetical protein